MALTIILFSFLYLTYLRKQYPTLNVDVGSYRYFENQYCNTLQQYAVTFRYQ